MRRKYKIIFFKYVLADDICIAIFHIKWTNIFEYGVITTTDIDAFPFEYFLF